MTRIRFRTDSWSDALDARSIAEGGDWSEYDTPADKRRIIATAPARDGDTWVCRYALTVEEKAAGKTVGATAGYTIICPRCHQAHSWTTANNCSAAKTKHSYRDKDGTEHTYSVCAHNGVGSCWNWSGSGPDGTLTASPSLHCPPDLGGCGWHGWLRSGELTEC